MAGWCQRGKVLHHAQRKRCNITSLLQRTSSCSPCSPLMDKESYRTVRVFKKKIGEAKYKRKMDKSWRAIECTSRRWELRATHPCQNHHDACCASRDMQKRNGRDRHENDGHVERGRLTAHCALSSNACQGHQLTTPEFFLVSAFQKQHVINVGGDCAQHNVVRIHNEAKQASRGLHKQGRHDCHVHGGRSNVSNVCKPGRSSTTTLRTLKKIWC